MSNENVVLVTGGTGSQGGATVTHLLAAKKVRVRVLTRNLDSPKAKSLAARGVELVKGDFDDVASLKTMIGRLIFWIGNHVREGALGRIPDQSDHVPCLARLGRQRRRTIAGEDDLRAVTREQWAAPCSNIRSIAPVRHRAEIGAA
jgi:NAD(P)-dependent dehydrogenase (short-subunit alcohol dehydrogenase family)